MTNQLATDFIYDVFISYSSQDKGWVRGDLLTALDAAGLKTFIDFRDFDIGAPSIMEMERGVVTSRKTLLVLTPAYLDSDWTTFETLMLQTLDPINRARRLIPLLKERCDLPTRIGMLTYVDFTNPTTHETAWQRLLRALGTEGDAAPPPPPPTDNVPPPTSGPSPAAVRQLRTVLAQLYPDQSSARRVADDAGLNTAAINWHGSATDFWHALLQAAQHNEQLPALLAIAADEYPNSSQLATSIQGVQP